MAKIKTRKVYNFTLFNKKIFTKENDSKKDIYRKVINQCCMPWCKFGYDLNVHHIVPLNKGGTDTLDNYFILCSYCHKHSRLHSKSEEKRISLLVYKFMIEQNVLGLGITSDDYSDDEFWKVLKNKAYGFNYKIYSKKEQLKEMEETGDNNIDKDLKEYGNSIDNKEENL